jgi:uncharacterized protein YfaS (alpha-2-macroglobulin family)
MKNFYSALLFGLVMLLSMNPSARAATPEEALAAANKLATQGNYREAADAFKALLQSKDARGETLAKALNEVTTVLNNLGEAAEAETVIEDAAKAHAQHWQVLAAAGNAFMGSLPHQGQIVDGTFQRGGRRSDAPWAWSMERDRVRGLQLLLAARAAMPKDAPVAERSKFLQQLVYAWRGDNAAWKLQALTDLQTLPEPSRDYPGRESRGYPVDAAGEPVFFAVPASYEAAKSDGERLRLAFQEWSVVDNESAMTARYFWADLVRGWLGVQTLAGMIKPSLYEEGEGLQRSSIATLHTLAEDETIAQLATGPKRFKLPEDYQFMRLLRGSLSTWNAVNALIDELLNRRQFDKAVVLINELLPTFADKDLRAALNQKLTQITGLWGRLEPMEAQPAGTKAELSLVFRNATKVDLVARRVDVAKLLADTQTYLKTKPQDRDWQRANVEAVGQRLIAAGGDKYLSKPVAEWSQDLQPAPKHWDKRTSIETPLSEAGAYLIEATFAGKNPTRALLWLNGITLVQTKQAEGMHYFLCDAVTGAPIPEAKVSFFGYKTEWRNEFIVGRKQFQAYTFNEFMRTTDANGVVKTSQGKMDDYQWLVKATDAAGRLSYSGFENLWFSGRDEDRYENSRIYTITDRPVYRPAQEVKWRVWARAVGYDPKLETNAFAGNGCVVTITDPKGEKVHEKTYKADDWGAVEDVLKLGDEATLGSYQINITFNGDRGPYGSHSFRVEEYKKPEFEVKVNAPDKPVALGDAFEFTIKADYYFGGPVKEGKVKYKVQRSVHTAHWFPAGRWDWLFGEGYGWRSTSYLWYPGARNWCICSPRWPWMNWRSDPPELVAEGESVIAADGTLKVKIDSALAKELHGDEDHRYEIEVEVTDSSRRTIFGKGSVLAARKAFEAYVWLDRGWYQTGDAAQISVSAKTLDGRAVEAKGKVTVFKLTYAQDGSPKEESVHEADVALKDEPVMTTIKWSKPGQYRVEVKLTDAAGHESEASSFVVVRGEGFDGKDYRFDDLELVTQKEEYQPGDEVEVLINTNRPGSTIALFVRGTNGDPLWLKPEGKSASYIFKLSEADQPNIFLEAYTVSDARLHKVTRQIIVPPTKRIASVELITDKPTYLPRDQAKATLKVKDQDGEPFIGQVVLTAYDKALEYISGGSNQDDIRPYFWGWKRSHSSSITDTMRSLDAGLLKEGEQWMSGLGAFGNTTADASTVTMSGGVGGGFGRSMARAKSAMPMEGYAMSAKAPMALAAPAPASAMAEAAPAPADSFAPGGSGEDSAAPVMIRSNLADSAVWVASVKTNESGEAVLDFPMPDNLTTWKLKSWVMGADTQVGEASVEVITRKNLMVRLQAPRFFIEKDEVTISANVHNETDVEQGVKAVLDTGSEGILPSAADGKIPSLLAKIPAHSEHRFDWRVKAMKPGEVKITVKALAKDDSDAMEMTFPVYEHGTLKTEAWSLALRSDQPQGSITFNVPEERKPETTRLEVRYSPTLALAMIDALPYLADYPYGCTEQTLNRFVPTVITLGVLKDLGVDLKQVRDKRVNLNAQEIGKADDRAKRWQGKDRDGDPKEAVFDEDKVLKMARAGMNRLEAMRNDDGGWGWFPGGRESSVHITAQVVHGLILAKASGMKLDNDLITSGTQWLTQYADRELARLQLPEKHKDRKAFPDDTDALVHSVLVEAGAGNAAMRAALYEHRAKLSHLNLALLGLAFAKVEENERRDMCVRNLRQFVKQDDENQTAWLDLPENGWWYWWHDPIETQAAFLKLLCTVEPKGDLAARIAKHLLNNRRNGTYWNSTRDTAGVIDALAVFVKASGESKPDVKLEVVIDGVVKKQVSINADNLFSFDSTLVIEGEALSAGKHTLELRKQGGSPLYANAYLTLFSKEDMIPAAGLEVKVQRKFYKLTEQKTKDLVAGARGQALQQQGIKYVRTELASGDPLISGDLVEVELSIDSKNDYEYVLIADPKPAGFEPVEVQSGWSYEGLNSYQEYRDEKVAFFAERLPQGRHNVSYRVKAEIPGRFSALPTKAEAMYAPELRANAAEWKASIEDAK